MTRLVHAMRFTGFGGLMSLGSQQVARSNAATAAAVLIARRREREDVDAYLAQRLDTRTRHSSRIGTA
jgi:hypothetical protein